VERINVKAMGTGKKKLLRAAAYNAKGMEVYTKTSARGDRHMKYRF